MEITLKIISGEGKERVGKKVKGVSSISGR